MSEPIKGVSKAQGTFKERSRNFLKGSFLSVQAIYRILLKYNPLPGETAEEQGAMESRLCAESRGAECRCIRSEAGRDIPGPLWSGLCPGLQPCVCQLPASYSVLLAFPDAMVLVLHLAISLTPLSFTFYPQTHFT